LNVPLSPILVLAALASPPPEAAPDRAPVESVAAAARAAESASGAVIGVSALLLESGHTASHRGGETFQMASVFKVPVAVAVLGAVEKGALRLEEDVEIHESDRRKIGPLDDEWKPGMRVTVGRMVDVMLVFSDNTAADKLIALLGGPHEVEKDLASRGVPEIRISLDEKGMGAAMRKDLAAFERGSENGATPDGIRTVLTRLYRGELLSRASTDRILGAMRRCATGDRRLRAGLPNGTEIADKTGTAGSCANDAGIVTLPDGTHLALVVFVRGGRDAAKRDAAIASVAKAAWGAFAKARQEDAGRPVR